MTAITDSGDPRRICTQNIFALSRTADKCSMGHCMCDIVFFTNTSKYTTIINGLNDLNDLNNLNNLDEKY